MLREDSDEEELDYSDEENEEAIHARMLDMMSKLEQAPSDFQTGAVVAMLGAPGVQV